MLRRGVRGPGGPKEINRFRCSADAARIQVVSFLPKFQRLGAAPIVPKYLAPYLVKLREKPNVTWRKVLH